MELGLNALAARAEAGSREGDMASFDLKEIERRMRGAAGVLKQEFGGLRTGRASASLLDPIMVMAYGNPMPLNELYLDYNLSARTRKPSAFSRSGYHVRSSIPSCS